MKRYRCIVKGKVQGVWYRRHVAEMAREAGFAGYVKNLPDGNVEAVVDCNPDRLERFEKLLLKGSPMSIVTEIDCKEIPLDSVFTTFKVVR
ncbi:acylphosphatase [Hydrogenimonas urashimensis]|uniref:acylphosphatase n=1 Tax=Hydrogenimonas urashimensis TaxID=2740515 RepID=UPI001915FFC6|nr:acylphosphatase [Hydrogenimonas urashimensis]